MTITPRYSPSGPPLVIEPPTSGFDPLFRQLYLDTTKPDGGNGSIGAAYNTWANTMSPLEFSGGSAPWVINLAQGIDASGTPIPNIQADGHNTGRVKLQGPIQSSTFSSFENANVVVTGLVVAPQQGNDFALNIVDLTVIGLTLPPSAELVLTGENSIISSVAAESGTVTGFSYLVNCSLTSITLFAWNLHMVGGTLDSTIEVDSGNLDDVEILSSCDFKWSGTLRIRNSRFEAGSVLRCSSSNQLDLDLDSWGSMVSAGVTFPDTFPTMVITPWVPVVGTVLKPGADAINPGGVFDFDLGTIFPQEAEKSTACIVSFGAAPNTTDMIVVGSFIDASRHLHVLVKNTAATTQNLTDATFTAIYLPRLSP